MQGALCYGLWVAVVWRVSDLGGGAFEQFDGAEAPAGCVPQGLIGVDAGDGAGDEAGETAEVEAARASWCGVD